MEYGLDNNGKKVHHHNASKYGQYVCPDCFEQVILRTGFNACFYHTPIKDRTPLQRTCPEYHENKSYSKIDNDLDRLYINNGGIPLYLCGENNRFELRAYFPDVTEYSMRKLREADTRIHVNTNSGHESDKAVYSVNNLKFYKVTTRQPWIYVNCIPETSLPEVKRKWLWGIRGVDESKDIYHSNINGGYRLALKANVSVGKTYRVMFQNYAPDIDGLKFTEVGKIGLKDKNRNIDYLVYEMEVVSYTEKARGFIERKGYRLTQKSDELLPLWPPAIFSGSQLTFDGKEALFLHINNSEKEKVYSTDSRGLNEISDNKGIIRVPIISDKAIAVSENYDMIIPEIKYNTLYKSDLINKPLLKLDILIRDTEGNPINFSDKELRPSWDGKYFIKSNLPFTAAVSNENYILFSSNVYFEKVDYFRQLTINSRAFGIRRYLLTRKYAKNTSTAEINWQFEYSKISRCSGTTTNNNYENLMLLYLISKNLNAENISLYRLLEKWIKTNTVPVSAQAYLNEMFRRLV